MTEKLFIVFVATDIQATKEVKPEQYVDNRFNECKNACPDSVGFTVVRDLCVAQDSIKKVLSQNTRPCAIIINQSADIYGNFYDNTRNLFVTPLVFWKGAQSFVGLKTILEEAGKGFTKPIYVIASQPGGETFAKILSEIAIKEVPNNLRLKVSEGKLKTIVKEIMEDMSVKK